MSFKWFQVNLITIAMVVEMWKLTHHTLAKSNTFPIPKIQSENQALTKAAIIMLSEFSVDKER